MEPKIHFVKYGKASFEHYWKDQLWFKVLNWTPIMHTISPHVPELKYTDLRLQEEGEH